MDADSSRDIAGIGGAHVSVVTIRIRSALQIDRYLSNWRVSNNIDSLNLDQCVEQPTYNISDFK